MRDAAIFVIHLIATIAKLIGPGRTRQSMVAGCRGVNERLERYFDKALERARDE